MAPRSSVLAWRIPGMAEHGGLLSTGLHRIEHDWSYLAAAAVPFNHLCHHTKIIIIDYIHHAVHFIARHIYCNWKFVPLYIPHLFQLSPDLCKDKPPSVKISFRLGENIVNCISDKGLITMIFDIQIIFEIQ